MRKGHFKFAVCTITILMACAFLSSGEVIAGPRPAGESPLPAELREVSISERFIPSKAPRAGVIEKVIGRVLVLHEGSKEAFLAKSGDVIYRRDTIVTQKGARCRFRALSEDLFNMGDETRIRIDDVETNVSERRKRSVFSMAKGKAMFYALKLFRFKKVSMRVLTPTVVAGVRGTQFYIGIDQPEYVEIYGKVPEVTVERESVVTVVTYNGTVGVEGRADGATGNLGPGDKGTFSREGSSFGFASEEFMRAADRMTSVEGTEMSPIAEEEAREKDDSEQGEAANDEGEEEGENDENDRSDSGGEDGTEGNDETDGDDTESKTTSSLILGETAPASNDASISDVVQAVNAASTEQQTLGDPVDDPRDNASGDNVGYFSAMLTKIDGGGNRVLEEVFISTKRQDMDANAWARGSLDGDTDYVRVDASVAGNTEPYMKWLVFDEGAKSSGDLEDQHRIEHTDIGRLWGAGDERLMEWGAWKMTDPFTASDGLQYLADNGGYYIFGNDTSTVMPSTGGYAYSGKSYGTYWISGGGTVSRMQGYFTCNVDFASGDISCFDFAVESENGQYQASISGGSGSVGSDHLFSIIGGDWKLSSDSGTTVIQADADGRLCYGSFYGDFSDGTDAMGGAWGMYVDDPVAPQGAAGIFQAAPRPVSFEGYYTGLLSRKSGSLYSWNDNLISKTRQNFAVSGPRAEGVMDSSCYTVLDVSTDASGSDRITSMRVNEGGGIYGLTGATAMEHWEMGHTSYMEWGKWNRNDDIDLSDGGGNTVTASLKNSGYYSWGVPAYGVPTNGTASYRGDAYGTFWTENLGVNMKGEFSCTVNYGSAPAWGSISGFELNVTSDTITSGSNSLDYSVSISGEQGAFTSETDFSLGNAGNWQIKVVENGTAQIGVVDSRSGYGSLYGNGGVGMSGVWEISDTYGGNKRSVVGGIAGAKQ